MYEKKIKQQLNDEQTYRKLPANPFPILVEKLNRMLKLAFDEGLLSKKKFEYMTVKETFPLSI